MTSARPPSQLRRTRHRSVIAMAQGPRCARPVAFRNRFPNVTGRFSIGEIRDGLRPLPLLSSDGHTLMTSSRRRQRSAAGRAGEDGPTASHQQTCCHEFKRRRCRACPPWSYCRLMATHSSPSVIAFPGRTDLLRSVAFPAGFGCSAGRRRKVRSWMRSHLRKEPDKSTSRTVSYRSALC